MGQRIDDYTWEELARIRLPGRVVPALFWTLPVGRWDHSVLEEYWDFFVRKTPGGVCQDLGVILLRDRHPSVGGQATAAALQDLLPRAELVHAEEARRMHRVLILAGNFPQPGWGLLLTAGGKPEELEVLLRRALNSVTATASAGWRESLCGAAERHHALAEAEGELKGGQGAGGSAARRLERLDTWLAAVARALSWLGRDRWLQAKFQIRDVRTGWVRALREELNTLGVGAEETRAWSEIPGQESGQLLHRINTAATLREGSRPDDKLVKHLLPGLGEAERAEFERDPAAWARAYLADLGPRLTAALADLQRLAGRCRGALAAEAERRRESAGAAQARVQEARRQYGRALAESVEALRELGPRFLVCLEAEARSAERSPRVVAWDPVRLVGWKLLAHGHSPDGREIFQVAQEVVRKARGAAGAYAGLPPDAVCLGAAGGNADGSFLTDCVHYVVSQVPERPARQVLVDVLQEWYRPGELRSLIEREGGKADPAAGADKARLADELVARMGWPAPDSPRPRPLCSFVSRPPAPPAWSGPPDCTALRIAAESFCKDLLVALVSQLPGGFDALRGVLAEAGVELEARFTGRPKEALAHLTLGAAERWLQAVVAAGGTADAAAADRLGQAVCLVNKGILDSGAVHHRPGTSPASPSAEAVRDLLASAEELVGEMPWHFFPVQQIGTLPRMLIGRGWSHSHPATDRTLHVLDMQGVVRDGPALVWNRNRINPVMPDVEFLDAPYPVD